MDQANYGITPPGYRLPAATRLGPVHLQVAQLQRSLDYYTEVLGLRVLDRVGSSAQLGPHGTDLVLLVLHERPGATPVPRHGRLGLYHFALLLPNRAALGGFLQHIAALGAAAGMSDHAVSEAIYLTDPDGLGIEVYSDRPRSSWQVQGIQLYMTTAHLDVPSLIEDAEPWQGMPAGTTLGHIHLFVDDLQRAAAFYHEAIGFDKIVWSYPGALFLSAGGYHHHLGTNTWAAGAPAAGEHDARLLEWTLVLPDQAEIARLAHSLEQAGHPVHAEADTRVAADPWRTRLRLVVD